MAGDNAKLKCVECNRTKRVGLFYKRKGTKRGYSKECKSCYKRSDSYAAALDRRYQKDFGITLAEYQALLLAQGGRCAVCHKRPGRRRLAVDHDHYRERSEGLRCSVRGLLCRVCNEYLGHIGDVPQVGDRLASYLRHPPATGKLD